MLLFLSILLVQPAEPSPEAIALGREVADFGTLASLLPIVAQKDIDDLIADNPTLTVAEQAQLRSLGARIFAEGRDRVVEAHGRAFATRLSIEQLRAIVAFQRTPAAVALRDATPPALVETIQSLGSVDLKGDIRTAFCREAGRLCPPQR